MRLKRVDKKDKWEKPKYGKFIVFLVICLNVWFANKTLNVFMTTGVEPVVLIGAWFTFTVGEMWLLAGITKKKIDKNVEDEESEEDIDEY